MSSVIKERLAETLNTLKVEGCYVFGGTTEADRTAAALVEWYNTREEDLDEGDLILLVSIAATGKFMFWFCPTCTADVYQGGEAVEEVDGEWRNFQCVSENDRASYPGSGENDLRCNHCRCFLVGENRMPLGGAS